MTMKIQYLQPEAWNSQIFRFLLSAIHPFESAHHPPRNQENLKPPKKTKQSTWIASTWMSWKFLTPPFLWLGPVIRRWKPTRLKMLMSKMRKAKMPRKVCKGSTLDSLCFFKRSLEVLGSMEFIFDVSCLQGLELSSEVHGSPYFSVTN